MPSKTETHLPLTMLLWTTASFGLFSGLAEGVGLLVAGRLRLLSHNAALAGTAREVLWAAPIFGLVLFSVIGFVVWLLLQAIGRRRLRAVVYVLAFLMFFSWISIPDRIHWAGAILFSLGLAALVSRNFYRFESKWIPFCRVAVPILILLTGAGAYVVQAVPQWREDQEMARLPQVSHDTPNILLVVMDTLRADRVSAYGYHRPTSPNMDRLAQEGVLFEQAFAASSWTLPTHASLLTGRNPSEHGAETEHFDGRYPTLSQVLTQKGYRTGAFSANQFWFTRQRGFGRGFLRFQDRFLSLPVLAMQTVFGRMFKMNVLPMLNYPDEIGRASAADINEAFLSWLDQSGQRPFFAFLNYYDVHGPYRPPQPFWGRFSKKKEPGGLLHGVIKSHRPPASDELLQDESDAYDGAIAYADHQLGLLLSELQSRGLSENTIVIITSDHGESFGEHGFVAHRTNLYFELIRVPLILHWKGKIPAGVRIQRPVSNSWVAATILDLIDEENPSIAGHSLTPAWTQPEHMAEWPILVQELHQMDSFAPEDRVPTAMGSMKSIVSPQWHYVVHETLGEELYNWPSDPQESRNLAQTPEGQEVAAGLKSKVPPFNSRESNRQ